MLRNGSRHYCIARWPAALTGRNRVLLTGLELLKPSSLKAELPCWTHGWPLHPKLYLFVVLFLRICSVQVSSVQSLSRVRLFATPWIAARQASLFITSSRSPLRLTSIVLVMPSSHLIVCHPLIEENQRDGWMASLTQWTWVWASSGSWWWTGRPGVLPFMRLQRVRHDWVTVLNWIVATFERS